MQLAKGYQSQHPTSGELSGRQGHLFLLYFRDKFKLVQQQWWKESDRQRQAHADDEAHHSDLKKQDLKSYCEE
jgi:hypothetical protein